MPRSCKTCKGEGATGCSYNFERVNSKKDNNSGDDSNGNEISLVDCHYHAKFDEGEYDTASERVPVQEFDEGIQRLELEGRCNINGQVAISKVNGDTKGLQFTIGSYTDSCPRLTVADLAAVTKSRTLTAVSDLVTP